MSDSQLLNFYIAVDYNIQGGCTAIYYAAKQGYVDIVQLLMEHGVHLELKDEVHTRHAVTVTVSYLQFRGCMVAILSLSGVARPGDLVGHKHGKWLLAA